MKVRAPDDGNGAGGGDAGKAGTSAEGSADAGKGKGAESTTLTKGTGAAGGDTTLTKGADGKGGESKDTKAAEGKGEKPAEKPAAVDYEKWEPKALEGVKRPDTAVKAFREAGKKFGLSAEQMQGLVDFDDERTKTMASEFRAEQERTQKRWLEDFSKDKDFGGSNRDATKADLDRVMKAYGDDPELRAWLDETGFGDFPPLLRFVARVGKATREDTIAGSLKNAGTKMPTTLAESLWPKKN